MEASARLPQSWIRLLPMCGVCCIMAMKLGQTRRRYTRELVLRGDAWARAWRLPKEEGSGIGPRTCNRNPERARRAASLAASRGGGFEAQTTARKNAADDHWARAQHISNALL